VKSVVDQELARAYRRLRDTGTLGQWTTRDEVGFIFGLGDHQRLSAIGRVKLVTSTREDLLRRYLQASNNRVMWGDIDRTTCLTVAAALIAAFKKEPQ
jgi:hypothetical protein